MLQLQSAPSDQIAVQRTLYDREVFAIPPSESAVMEVTACPVCGGTEGQPVMTIDGIDQRVVDCTTCGLGRLYPLPTMEEITAFYPPEYYGDTGAKFEPLVEAMVRVVAARHVRFLARGLPRGGRVLDVGCGRGVLLGAFADLGCEVHGVEVSETAVAGIDPRVKVRVVPRLVDADYADGYFDQVVMWHVLEHVPDPRETIEEIRRIVKPGGKAIIAVPNYGSLQARWAGAAWFHLDLPRHLYHFPASALRMLLEDGGFDCRSEHHFSLRQNPFGWVQSALNRSGRWPRNSLYTLLQRHSPHNRQSVDAWTRLQLRSAYLLGMPAALAVSVLAAMFRSGATVHIVATRRGA